MIEEELGREYNYKATGPGEHELKVVVTGQDACGNPYVTEHEWSVTVKERSQDGLESDLMTWLLIGIIIIVVAIIAALLLMKRKKKVEPTPAEVTEGPGEGLATPENVHQDTGSPEGGPVMDGPADNRPEDAVTQPPGPESLGPGEQQGG
jgi:hypothetical protein